MRWPAILTEPLEGKTSLDRVFWAYGVVGSLLYGALEFFIDSGDPLLMRAYIIGGLLFGVYVAVATYRCAGNCRSKVWTRMAQASAILSLVLLPLIAYLELSGALDIAMSSLL